MINLSRFANNINYHHQMKRLQGNKFLPLLIETNQWLTLHELNLFSENEKINSFCDYFISSCVPSTNRC